MEHSKLKLLFQQPKKGDWSVVHETARQKNAYLKIEDVDPTKFDDVLFEMDDETIVRGFIYQFENTVAAIPSPHPIVIYFETGRSYLKRIAKTKLELFNHIRSKSDIGLQNHLMYNYLANASSSVIFFLQCN